MKLNYKHFKLKNGLQVLLIPSKSTYSVNIMASTNSGSIFEDEKIQGITHFVEHMSLTATKKWPKKISFEEAIEQHGASYNGETSKEILKYYINIPKTQLEFGIEFIHEILYNCTFDEKFITQEKTVILDEIAKSEDSLGYRFTRFLAEHLGKLDSNYFKCPTIGNRKSIESFTKKELIDFYKTLHSPNKILLSVAGNFNEDKATEIIKKFFDSKKAVSKTNKYPDEKLHQSLIKSKNDKKTDLITSCISFEFPGMKVNTTQDTWYFSLLDHLLCGPMSSRLYKRLRIKEGLLYSISADGYLFDPFATSDFSFDCNPNIYEKVLKIAIEEIELFHSRGVTKDELDHMKQYMINRNMVRYDSILRFTSSIVAAYARNKEVLDLDQINKYIKSISLEKVNEGIKKYFDLKNANIFLYGNVNAKNESYAKSLLKR